LIRQNGKKHTGRDTLDTATASQTADGGLGDALDVVAQNLAVTLGAALAEALSALATYETTRQYYQRLEVMDRILSLTPRCSAKMQATGRDR
jgi:hypothetical protein